jgi:putative tryptophan/tyrosine transport system substrate-binding protein
MRRREFITFLVSAAAWPIAARAQKKGNPWRIGFLSPRSVSDLTFIDDFRLGMQDLGYVEGKDFVIEARYGNGEYRRLAAMAQELVELSVDVIVTAASPSIRAAQQATATIPIVMAGTGDPIASGLVANLARPGGNTTGLSLLSPDVSTKQVQFLTMLVPTLSRVAVVLNPGSSTRASVLGAVENAGRQAGIAILPVDAGTVQDIERGFTTMAQEHADAFLVMADGFLVAQGQRIAELAIRYVLPSVGEYREYVQRGGLMSYGPGFANSYRRAAVYVDKILKGARPGDIPIEQPTKFELFINLKTAKAIGVRIPDNLLALADAVIE